MNIIVIIKFMRISFEVSSVAATKLPSGWWPLAPIQDMVHCYNYHNSYNNYCMGAKCSQPTHFLQSR